MSNNHLKLNDSKTEFLVIGKPNTLKKMEHISEIRIGETKVRAVKSARNIGAVLDSELNMVNHVNSIVRSCYGHLREISHIRHYLTQEAAATLVNSIITSRLDYVNSLLFGLPEYTVRKLQLIQNNAARLVCRKRKRDHVTPLLKTLHWLPIDYRIQFKINLLTYKSLHGLAPSYLSCILTPYQPSRTLRSTTQNKLLEKRARCKKSGDRAFPMCAPKLWNSLPVSVRDCDSVSSFKTALKTLYFKRAFGS
jgi:hypothetical protein